MEQRYVKNRIRITKGMTHNNFLILSFFIKNPPMTAPVATDVKNMNQFEFAIMNSCMIPSFSIVG